jgi:hypothetical protein
MAAPGAQAGPGSVIRAPLRASDSGTSDLSFKPLCNRCYFSGVNGETTKQWLVLVLKLPAQPSRHRVAVWRELRRVGALSLGQGVWAVPEVPVFADGIQRALELTERAEGESLVLQATGRGPVDAERFQALFTAARQDDWNEFLADCGKYEAELDKEIAKQKFTLAELEEEEQSMERLRRWHRDIKARDVFGAPGAGEADRRLKDCAERFEDYSERVFRALHASGPGLDGGPV